jgi:hypothetical protein
MLIAFYSDVPGCGKTTAAQYLSREHKFVKLSFANVIADMVKPLLEAFGYDFYELYTPELKNQPLERIPGYPSVRGLMQTLGTEWGRKLVDRQLWVAAMEYNVNRLLDIDINTNIVIDDMRFPNEYDMVMRCPTGRAVKIAREVEPLVYEELRKHSSNGALASQDYDWFIYNKGSKEDLEAELEKLLMTPPY